MEGPPLGPGGEDLTWPNQVAPRGRKASSTRKIKPQTSNLCNLAPPVFLAFWRHGVATWGQDAKIGEIGRLGWVATVGFPGVLVEPSLDSRALMSPLVLFGLLSRWLLTVRGGDGHTTGEKKARIAKLGNVARTVSCITPARPNKQIQKPRALDPYSFATEIALHFGIGPLPHGDMVFPAWRKMAKTAKIGQNGPHSRSHISMEMASSNLTKVPIDIWHLGPNICPI